MPKEYDEEIIGSLWQRESKYGPWFTGYVKMDGKDVQVVIFANKNLKTDKSPTHRILRSKPKQEAQPEPEQTTIEEHGEDVPF